MLGILPPHRWFQPRLPEAGMRCPPSMLLPALLLLEVKSLNPGIGRVAQLSLGKTGSKSLALHVHY